MAARQPTVPYNDAQLAEVRKVFKSDPSYRAEDDTVDAGVIPKLAESVKYDRTSEQIKAFQDWHVSYTNSRLSWKHTNSYLRNLHQNDTFLGVYAETCDKDGNGFISEDEFDGILKLLLIQKPELAGSAISFEDFVKEADTNKDGKVSIEECKKWIREK